MPPVITGLLALLALEPVCLRETVTFVPRTRVVNAMLVTQPEAEHTCIAAAYLPLPRATRTTPAIPHAHAHARSGHGHP